MDDKMLDKLDDISENFDYLIHIIEENIKNNKKEPVFNDLDSLSDDFSFFNSYLIAIEKNTKESNTKLSAYLDNINTLNNDVTDDVNILEFNNSIKNLIIKLDELQFDILNINKNLNINIDTTQLNDIKDTLQNDVNLSINTDNITSQITNVEELLSNIKMDDLNIDLEPTINNLDIIKNQLLSINNFNFENLDFNVLNDVSFDNLINSLNELENKSNIDLSKLKQDLLDIKNIDFQNIDFEKIINIENLDKKLDIGNYFKEPIILNFDFNDFYIKASNIEKEISLIKDIDLNVNPNIDSANIVKQFNDIKNMWDNIILTKDVILNYDVSTIDNVKNKIEDTTVNIIPKVDNSFIDDIKMDIENTEFDIKLNPYIQDFINIPVLETKNESEIKIIKTEESLSNTNSDIKKLLEINNELLSNLFLNNKKETSTKIIESKESITNESLINISQDNKNNLDNDRMLILQQQTVELLKTISKKLSIKNHSDLDHI